MPKNQPTASQDARRTQKRTGAKYTAALRAEQVRPAVHIRPGDRGGDQGVFGISAG